MKKTILIIVCIIITILIISIAINFENIKNHFKSSENTPQQTQEPISTEINTVVSNEITQEGFEDNEYIYYDFSNITNSTENSLNDFVWHDSLPTDALRINRIYTGTWNQDIKYSIWYKTNLNDDYKLLINDLSTQKNNEIDFTKISLNSKEYITDFEFRFGTVMSKFKEVEQPRLYCDILNTIENGFKYTNSIKIFGSFENNPFESKNSFSMIRNYKEIHLENQPR